MKSLVDIFYEHHGKVSDKWSSNVSEYDRLLVQYREKPVRLLEIGVQNGGSLEIWGKYFINAEFIIGCDINPNCGVLEYEDSRIKVVVGDAAEDAAANSILGITDELDLVIDDGSHLSSDVIRSFIRYFPKISFGGLYIIEDLHCSYWGDYQGGLFNPVSSMAFLKRLADAINYEHWGVSKPCDWLFNEMATKYGFEKQDFRFSEVHSVEFLNSMCVIRKQPEDSNRLGSRCVVGDDSRVHPGVQSLSACCILTPSQIDNPWTALEMAPEEAWENQKREIGYLHDKLSGRESELKDLHDRNSELQTQVEKLKKFLSYSDLQIVGLQDSSANLITMMANLKQSLCESERQVSQLSKALAEQEIRNSVVSGELYLMRHSTSWTVTAPCRWIVRQGIKVKEFLVAGVYAFRRLGGVHGIGKKIWSAHRRSGISGLYEGMQRVNLLVSNCFEKGYGSVGRSDYDEWIRCYDTIDEKSRNLFRTKIISMHSPPLLSVVMPVYNPKPEWLNDAIRSVQNQIYPHWELCIADDASTCKEIRTLLERFVENDSRIKVVFREVNGHISEATNSALALATGSWVALLDHDDILPEHALYWVADTIIAQPDAVIVYTDEDKIDESDRRFSPHFKGDWNPDLLFSQNYISHLGVYRREMLEEIGGFRAGLEGSQDHDLILRCLRRKKKEEKIVHIPRVLYHWRAGGGSTAVDPEAKKYTSVAGIRALQDHFADVSQDITVQAGPVPNTYRVCYPIPQPAPLVSLLIPTRDQFTLLETCVHSLIERTAYPNLEILIIDNCSIELETQELLRKLQYEDDRVRVIKYNKPFNFSAINNFGVRHARGSIIGLINNDVEVISPDWLSVMVSHASRQEIGCVGAKLYYDNNTIQHAGIILGIGRVAGHSHKYFNVQSPGYFSRLLVEQSVSAVTAACLVVRRTVYEQVQGLDEASLKIAFNDVDFCLKVREAGYRNLWTPYAQLYHHESMTRGLEDTPEKKARFNCEVEFMVKTWGKTLSCDPYYNPNLSLLHEDFSLAWPPRLAHPPSKSAETDELMYLRKNPDVATVVKTGQYGTGWKHFTDYGAGEGRTWGAAGRIN